MRRPCGQRPESGGAPSYGPTRRLDIEAELGFVVGAPSRQGERVSTAAFADHVFGVTLLNDWSARDIQAWEYVPLGPFLGKSFATSVSGWITPLDALAAARVDLPGQDPEPLDYLRVEGPAGYDVDIEVVLNGETVSRPPYASMYWSPAQMLAHLTANGASLRTGDLFASRHGQRGRARPARVVPRAVVGRHGALRRRPDLLAGRRHRGAARHRAEHRRRPDRPRRGHRQDQPGMSRDRFQTGRCAAPMSPCSSRNATTRSPIQASVCW